MFSHLIRSKIVTKGDSSIPKSGEINIQSFQTNNPRRDNISRLGNSEVTKIRMLEQKKINIV